MRKIIFVDENDQPIEEHEIRPHPFLPRKGETICLTRWVTGEETGKYFKTVDRIDKYEIVDVQWLIEPTFNQCTNIDVKIIVKKIN
jgi:hypothetical protein